MNRLVPSVCLVLLLLASHTLTHTDMHFESFPFVFMLQCSGLGTPDLQDVCRQFKTPILNAASRITSELSFNAHINVLIRPYDRCLAHGCPELNTLASTSIVKRFPVVHNDDHNTYLYPSALYKQLHPATTEWHSRVDIALDLNALYNWCWMDNLRTLCSHRTMQFLIGAPKDLELTLTHELIHGLGYGDDLILSFVPNPHSELLMPFYESSDSQTSETAYNDGIHFFRFARPSIWDRFTVTTATQTPLLAYSSELNSLAMDLIDHSQRSVDPNHVISLLVNDRTGSRIMRDLYELSTTPNAVQFDPTAWPPNAPRASVPTVLETSLNPFVPGSSTIHSAAASSSEFLMYWTSLSSDAYVSLNDLITRFGAPPSGIGRATKSALLALGYSPATTKHATHGALDRVPDLVASSRVSSSAGTWRVGGDGVLVLLMAFCMVLFSVCSLF